MVPVFVHIVGVGCFYVEPRVFFQFGAVGIEFVHGVESCGVVEHHIYNDGDAAFVAFVDEGFQVVLATVSAVGRKVVVGRVAPVVVAVKFANGHQFEGVHA